MGGNVIPNSKSVTIENFHIVLNNLKELLPNNITIYPIGSAGKKKISSDLDVLIDADELLSTYPTAPNLKTAKQFLEDDLKQKGYIAARTGVSVHVGVPTGVNSDVVQVDIMIVEDAKDAAPLHTHDYSYDQNMRGGTLHAIWADLANMSTYQGESSFINTKGELKPILMISPYKGLMNRKTGELITSDKDKIAKIIIGPCATEKDMSSTVTIMNSLKTIPSKFEEINTKYFNDQFNTIL